MLNDAYMTHEQKLIALIERSQDPTEAAKVAIQAILCYAEQLQRPITYCPVPPLEFGGTDQ